jgi:hypothetical protein
MGEENPGLINYNIAHFLENKWFEYKYWEDLCSGFLAQTKLLYDILPEGVDKYNVPPEILMEVANTHFPNGWIIKGVWDYNGIHHRITSKMDVVKHYYDYKNSTFESFLNDSKLELQGCEPVEGWIFFINKDLNELMNRHPNFLGAKIAQLLNDSSQTFLQQFVDIKREYRIECTGGICPISCMDGDEDWQDIDSKQKIFDFKEDMHHFFMQCVNTIPTSLRGIPLSADITLLKNDSYVTIETNPGGNGWNVNNDP